MRIDLIFKRYMYACSVTAGLIISSGSIKELRNNYYAVGIGLFLFLYGLKRVIEIIEEEKEIKEMEEDNDI